LRDKSDLKVKRASLAVQNVNTIIAPFVSQILNTQIDTSPRIIDRKL